jgi:4'-phosphopantetheinyl transferase
MGEQDSGAVAQVRPCSGWGQPPASPVLGRDDVHVWRIPLDLPQRLVGDLVPLLSAEEKARAARILSEEAGRRFIVSHGATRVILSRYLDEGPEQIGFAAGEEGKPYLLAPAGTPAVHFSLSHSGELALCAVAQGREVGVDVERVHPVSAWRQIATRYFSERENQALGAWPDGQTVRAFFQVWTRKEAYTKALGRGVSRHWTQFTVSLETGAAEVVRGAPSDVGVQGPFTLCPLEPGSGYVAAVAAQGTGWCLSCWHW